MKFQINSKCIKCGACALDCPVMAVRHGGAQFVIGEKCIGCGDCFAICPVGAVYMVKAGAVEEKKEKSPEK